MNITEELLAEDISRHIPGAAKEGASLLGVSTSDEPRAIVEAINDFIAKPGKKTWFKKIDNWYDRALPLGALWGTQMVRHFGWEWAMVIQHDHDDFKVAGVFDKRRSLAVYPFHFVFGCIENDVYPTILLAFNMLEAGTIPSFDDRAYVNMMDGVHHVVPPR